MDPRTLAQAQAVGRIGFGLALALAPRRVARTWIGRRGAERSTSVITIGLGARDLALGVGLMQSLRNGRGASEWLQAAVLADAADLIGTLRARDAIPAAAVVAVGALAGGSVGLGLHLLRSLDQSAP